MPVLRGILVGVVLLFSAQRASSAVLSLPDYLMEVISQNPAVSSSIKRQEAAKNLARASGSLDDPVFSFGMEDIPVSGEDMGSVRKYQLTQSFPFPGKRSTKEEIANKQAFIGAANVETTKREFRVLGTQTYYRVLYNQYAQKLNHDLKGLLESQVASSSNQYKSGEGSHHEWLVVKVAVGTLEVEASRLKRESRTLQALFNELRGQPADTTFPALALQESKSSSDTWDTLVGAQPELIGLKALLETAELERSLARKSYLPDFMIQGMYMEPRQSMTEEKPSWGFMVGMGIPIYSAMNQSSRVEAATALLEARRNDQEALTRRLRSEFIDSQEQLQSAIDIVTLYKTLVLPNAQLTVQSAKSGYANRRLPLAEFIDSLKINRQLQLEYLAAQIDAELAKARASELLSSPPLLRLAPSKPSIFGSSSMGENMGMAGSSPTVQPSLGRTVGGSSSEPSSTPSTSSGMGNM